MIEPRKRHMTDAENQRAKELRRGGLSYETISDALRDESVDKRKFDRATIYRVCSSMPDLPIDEPFQWRNIQDYGIPWESSSYILDFWAQAVEFLSIVQQEPDLSGLPAALRRLSPSAVYSGRHARWWWRVHQAAPDLRFDAVLAIAFKFSSREYMHEVLGLPIDLADLQGFLSYRPWLSKGHCETYLRAISERRVQSLNGVDLNDEDTLAIFEQIPSDGVNLLRIFGLVKN